jgi:hypothetical protein
MRVAIRHPLSGTTTVSFPEFLDHLMKGGTRGTRSYALDHGVDEAALARYTSGAVTVYERQEITNVISRNEWARSYVVNLVKQRRRHRSAA